MDGEMNGRMELYATGTLRDYNLLNEYSKAYLSVLKHYIGSTLMDALELLRMFKNAKGRCMP